MRRNILTYKTPQNNEGYDLICIHPDPRHRPSPSEAAQVRVQVKSRYATDCDRGFPVRLESLNAFDFLVVAFLNIDRFGGRHIGLEGEMDVEFYTLPKAFVVQHHIKESTWQKVRLRGLEDVILPYKNATGFEQIATALGVVRPTKIRC